VARRDALVPSRRVHPAAGDGQDEEGFTASTPPSRIRSRGGGRARRRNQKEAGRGTNSPALGRVPHPPTPAPKRNLCVPSGGSPRPKTGTARHPPPAMLSPHPLSSPLPGIAAPRGPQPPPHAGHARHPPSPEAARLPSAAGCPRWGGAGRAPAGGRRVTAERANKSPSERGGGAPPLRSRKPPRQCGRNHGRPIMAVMAWQTLRAPLRTRPTRP